MSDLSTVCTFALGSLWLRFASDGVIWGHVSISRRWSDDALGFLAGEPTVFVLLQACKLIFEARGLIVSIFGNRGKGVGVVIPFAVACVNVSITCRHGVGKSTSSVSRGCLEWQLLNIRRGSHI